ncbi:C39 family peptidase [Lederbergia sp. NSJ-179]|uniref:C39 family peptidase n=1 Tax=Lederbergia sp. NSJ-179 TaxID=2931402 RepID=UPI001FD3A59E|nr:C39 family peptidase [Lederbergia sp. NSJ-179]MCJ7842671.1 C39 family peptidase [Lederbergia sp. NSJ-179]
MKTLLLLIILFILSLLILFIIKKSKFMMFAGIVFIVIMFFKIDGIDTVKNVFSKVSPLQSDLSLIKIKEKIIIDTPVIAQLPELPRGCEVTSLAMLLENAGVKADKMELAEKIKKNPAQKEEKDGKIYYGDPHNGFIGDMYTFDKPGLGVYHEPIMELAESYLPGQIINLTGQSFEELKIPLSDRRPVWVIINAEYRELEDSYFQTWYTESGEIRITMKEHSVLMTGYDDQFVYFNDPLMRNEKAPIHDFEKAWVQMGSQALTYSK